MTRAEADSLGRSRVHLALAGVVTLLLSPLFSWAVALVHPTVDAGRWRRRLFGLAAVDTVLWVSLLALLPHLHAAPSRRDLLESPPRSIATQEQTARIGTMLNPVEPPDGVEVVGVTAASPAEQAGLHPGDVITHVDTKPVAQNLAFIHEIRDTAPGQARVLHVRRQGVELDVSVVPARNLPSLSTRRLFGHATELDKPWSVASVLWQMQGRAAVFVIVVLLAGMAWFRQRPIRPGLWVVAAVIVPLPVALAIDSVFRHTTGRSIGGLLIGWLMGGAAMLVVGLLASHRPEAEGSVPDRDPLATLPAFVLGLFYAFTGAVRAAIVAYVLSTVVHLTLHGVTETLGVSGAWGPWGLSLYAVYAVVLGPVAEEYVFRGVLLPWLLTWMRPAVAVIASALVFGLGHLHYGTGLLVVVVYGIVFGWMRLRTGRLRAGIALHMFINGAITTYTLLNAVGR